LSGGKTRIKKKLVGGLNKGIQLPQAEKVGGEICPGGEKAGQKKKGDGVSARRTSAARGGVVDERRRTILKLNLWVKLRRLVN